jgi:hypothetical protein
LRRPEPAVDFELADLFVELVFFQIRLLAHLLSAVAEDVG